jgi:epoxyqueuosine reductase
LAFLRSYPPLEKIATMGAAEYETFFGGTPLTRAKRSGLRRNALIAMAVTGAPQLSEALAQVGLEDDPVLLATRQQIETYLTKHTVLENKPT